MLWRSDSERVVLSATNAEENIHGSVYFSLKSLRKENSNGENQFLNIFL